MPKRGRGAPKQDEDDGYEDEYEDAEQDDEATEEDADEEVEEEEQEQRARPSKKSKKNAAKRHRSGPAHPPGPPPDSMETALRQLQRVAPALSREAAKEALEAVLARNPNITSDIDTWVDEAQVEAAILREVNAEAAQMGEAMAVSLAEIEVMKQREEEEEKREGRLSAVKRKYADSPLLAELLLRVCPALLLNSSAYEPLTRLLALEKRSKKWYSGRGTYYYYEQLASQLGTQLLELAGISVAGSSNAATGSAAAGNGARVRCGAPGCDTCASGSGGSLSAAGSAALARFAKVGGSTHGSGEAGVSGSGATGEAGSNGVDGLSPRALPPWLDAFGKALESKEQHIQVEVAKMPLFDPAEAKSKQDAEAKLLTHIPPLFRLPPGMDEMEVVECFSDGDD